MTRQLTFAPKTQHQRRARDTAIAWVTAQQPNRMFESANVTATIHRALKALGFPVDQRYIKYGMDALVEAGYAESLVIGRRTTMFMLKEDVEVPVPVFIAAAQRRNGARADTPAAAPAATKRPALPRQPVQEEPPVVIHDLHMAVRAWWREEPEAAEAWATDAIEALR